MNFFSLFNPPDALSLKQTASARQTDDSTPPAVPTPTKRAPIKRTYTTPQIATANLSIDPLLVYLRKLRLEAGVIRELLRELRPDHKLTDSFWIFRKLGRIVDYQDFLSQRLSEQQQLGRIDSQRFLNAYEDYTAALLSTLDQLSQHRAFFKENELDESFMLAIEELAFSWTHCGGESQRKVDGSVKRRMTVTEETGRSAIRLAYAAYSNGRELRDWPFEWA